MDRWMDRWADRQRDRWTRVISWEAAQLTLCI